MKITIEIKANTEKAVNTIFDFVVSRIKAGAIAETGCPEESAVEKQGNYRLTVRRDLKVETW